SNDIPFVERSIDNTLIMPYTDRSLGVRVETSGEHWFFAGGIYGDRVSPGGSGDEGWGPAARFIWAPLISQQAVLHLGLRGAWRDTGADASLSFDDETKDYFSQVSIVDTGVINGVENLRV